MNSGVCVKGSCYNDLENDYYGLLKEVIKVRYLGEENEIFIFNCEWFDTLSRNGIKVHHTNGLIELNRNSRLQTDDNFVFAQQCQQMYLLSKPGSGLNEWVTVIKTAARSRFASELLSPNLMEDVADVDQVDEIYQPSTVTVDNSLDQPFVPEDFDAVNEEELERVMQSDNAYYSGSSEDDENASDAEVDFDEDVDLNDEEENEDGYQNEDGYDEDTEDEFAL